MACELDLAPADPAKFESLGFYVVSPAKYAAKHERLITRESIERKVADRIGRYTDPCFSALEQWAAGPFTQLMGRITLRCLTWEAIIEGIQAVAPRPGDALAAFYRQCRDLS